MAPHTSHDVVVVGAAAAGAATALLLARAGLDVLVVDTGPRPALTPTAAVLTRSGVHQLRRWGLLDAVLATGTPPVRQLGFRYATEAVDISVRPALGVDAFYAPPLESLARLLRRAAVEAGVDMRHHVTASGLMVRSGRVVGVRAGTADGHSLDLPAALVVGADGVQSTIARCVRTARTRLAPEPSLVTCGYWSSLEVDRYTWSVLPGVRVGLGPSSDGRAFVLVGGPPDRVAPGGLPAIREALTAAAPELAAQLRSRPEPDQVPVWHVHRGFVRRSHGPGWALVGGAALAKDPTSVHGFTDVLRDAELLARAAIRGLAGDSAILLDEALAEYEATRNRVALPIFDVVERIASHAWDEVEIARLVQRLSSAMADEAELVADPGPGVVP